jgi:hypothetical protein
MNWLHIVLLGPKDGAAAGISYKGEASISNLMVLRTW